MTFHLTTLSHFWAPLKTAAQRFAYSALVLVSVAIIVIGKADVALVERMRTGVADFMAPVLLAMAEPVAAASAGASKLREMVGIYRENDRLRAENETLLRWQSVARRLDSENQALRDLTRYQPGGATWYITARVIAAGGGAYSRSLLVDRGSEAGVRKGQAVTSGTGLVGRVAEVGTRAARILLVTDVNSRIPVALQSSHERAVLAGDNTELPLLAYLAPQAKLEAGEQVITSGDGGVFPPGIPVGVVISSGGYARVALATDLSAVGYLKIVDFGLSGLLPTEAVPPPKPAKPARAEPAKP